MRSPSASETEQRPTPPHTRARAGSGIARGVVRLAAGLSLLAGLVALPLAVVMLVGLPQRGALADTLRTGRLDDTAIVQLGTVLFLVLWAWFAATAVGEVVRVAAWRAHPRSTPLEPLNASPTGWVRRLVRVAMISSTAVVGSGLLSVIGAVSPTPISAAASFTQPSPALSTSAGMAPRADHVAPANAIRSTGRDTPYSIAVRLGDPTLRDRIIELNRGTGTSRAGSVWTSGVFPEGMSITVPHGSLQAGRQAWTTHTVVAGDSVYRIAAALSTDDGGRVRDVADQIIDRNMGRIMNDGALFQDPSLISIGWVIEVPADVTASELIAPAADVTVADPAAHTVVRGESYWSIAEDHLQAGGLPAAGPDIAALTEVMIATNDPLLGHDLDTLILPGEQLLFPPVVVIVPSEPVVVAPVPADAEPAEAIPAPVAAADMPVAIPAEDTIPSTTPVVLPIVQQQAPVVAPDVAPDAEAPNRSPITTSLGAAVLLCAGALGVVETRRRHQLRRAPAGARSVTPTPRDVATERLLRTVPAAQRALRLDLALRSIGHHLAGSAAHVLAVTMTDAGTLTVLLHRPGRAAPAAPWRADLADPSRWVLDQSVDTDELIDSARLAGQPCPALVHLGTLIVDGDIQPGTALFVDLEAFGLLSIDAGGDTRTATDIVRAIAVSLAASPVGETLRMVTHDLDVRTHLGNLNAESAETIDAAIDCAAAALGSTPIAIGGRRTFELRARGAGGEGWEPVIVVSGATSFEAAALHDLVDVSSGGGRGLAAVLIGPIVGAGLSMTAHSGGWTVEPLGLRVVPVGLLAEQIDAVHDLLDAADRPLPVAEPDDDAAVAPTDRPYVEAPWQLVVRVLGHVDVTDRDGNSVGFDRGKALELATWLSLHRERPTRAAARTALWDLQVRDATFANVVSDARRAMGRAVTPPVDEEWIERTLTEQLPLHVMVTSDAELLRARLDASRGLPARQAIDVLRPGVEWIADLPFAGTGYLWPDAEGITSALTLLATAAAAELARHCLAIGDVDGVFWATGRGLQVLSGHEELIGLRMRAYAQRGDLAGVRSEWEVYERAIHADPWSSGEPSPKLVAIRRELLSR
jgi:LysM repeat protein